MDLRRYLKIDEKKNEYPKSIMVVCFFSITDKGNMKKVLKKLVKDHYGTNEEKTESVLEVHAEVQSELDLTSLITSLKESTSHGYITPLKANTKIVLSEW